MCYSMGSSQSTFRTCTSSMVCDVLYDPNVTWSDQSGLAGPIIRITPTELHIDDPDYYEVLYERAGRRDRYSYFAARFGGATDTFSTIPHELHRNRRKPLNPMFSAQRISQFQPVIRSMVGKLCSKFDELKKSGEVFLLDRAMMALSTDIITQYAFAKSYGQLDVPLFAETMHDALVACYVVGHFALHFPIVFPILDSFPDWFTLMVQPVLRPVVGIKYDLANEVKAIREGMNEGHKQAAHPTIFHELLNGDQPESEKTDARLGDEAQLIVAAGLVTTSRALSVGSFHLIANPDIVRKLREELQAAGIGTTQESFDWHKLEALPYLNGCVHESIRLAHGITTRSPRLAPDEELQYGEWVIAKNTPVSMTTVDILMNERIYPNPRKFDPERWIGHPELKRYFVPFAKGSRGCMGVK